MLRHITNLPNLFTSASVFCGLLSLTLASTASVGENDNLFKAALAIIFATLFDALDGRVARMTRSASEFGVQYDSLADVISFGVAPAFLVYHWGLAYYGGFGLVVAFVYVVAGAMRLARFNINAGTVSSGKWSQGLTITEAGGTLAVLIIVHHQSGAERLSNYAAVMITVLILSYLMVSNIRFRTFKDLRVTHRTLVGIALGFASAAYVLVLFRDFAFVLLFGLCLHIGSGLLEEVIFFRRRRLEEQQALVMEFSNGQTSLSAVGEEGDEALPE